MMAASERQLADLEGAFRFAEAAIKMLIGINGGAAIAVLTFYGNVLSREAGIQLGAWQLAVALLAFGLGVAAGAAIAVAGFYVQTARAGDPSPEASGERDGARRLGMVAALVSLAAFCAGVGFSAASLPVW